MKLFKSVLCFSVVFSLSSLGAAWLVRADGTGSVDKEEIKSALTLSEYQFQNKAANGGFTFRLNRTADYSVPCVAGDVTTWRNFRVVESDVPMNASPRINGQGKVISFHLDRGVGGTIVVRDASGNVVDKAACGDGETHSTVERTTIKVRKGGLVVNHKLLPG